MDQRSKQGRWSAAEDVYKGEEERRIERQLIADYEAVVGEIAEKLDAGRHTTALALASVPEKIRGYGPVKERNLATAKAEEAALLEAFRSGGAPKQQAAE